ELKNWRPITLLDVEYKIYTGCLNERLKVVTDELLHPQQFGFRSNRMMEDAVMSIKSAIGESKASGEDIAVVGLDFRKAFDTIFVQAIHNVLTDSESVIDVDGYPRVQLKRRVKQGDPLSPTLFL
ncbi:Uncharacterized protein FKW44_013057, partial [Caligus rogercresseyi]